MYSMPVDGQMVLEMIELIDHVAITARDLQETINFYGKFGFKPTNKNVTPTQTIQFLVSGQARLEVFVPNETKTPSELSQKDLGMKHIALKVNNVRKAYEEAKAQGIVFQSEPQKSLMGNMIAFFKDPNGILLQLIE